MTDRKSKCVQAYFRTIVEVLKRNNAQKPFIIYANFSQAMSQSEVLIY